MLSASDGVSSSRKGREGRPILTLKRIGTALQDSSKLTGVEQGNHSEIDAETQDFEAALWSARNKWDIARRAGGLFGSHRLSKSDADRALKRAMAEIGGAE